MSARHFFREFLGNIHSLARVVFVRFCVKARSVAGDSIAEALVAILIAALGASLLATMVMSSVNITTASQTRLNALHTAESTLAQTGGTTTTISVNISGTGLSSDVTLSNVSLFNAGGYLQYSEDAAT